MSLDTQPILKIQKIHYLHKAVLSNDGIVLIDGDSFFRRHTHHFPTIHRKAVPFNN